MAEILKLVPQDKSGRDYLGFWMMECIFLNPDNHMSLGYLPKPYEYADHDLKSLNPSEVSPTAKYVLRKNLEVIENLDKELSAEGIDIFNLEGVVKIDENNYICPPILEVWNQKPFNGVPVVVDGAHRLYIAKKRGINVNCMVVSGNISSDLPMLPLGGWSEVLEQDNVPKDKRNYAPGIPAPWKPHELYRQKFHGSTGPRTILGSG
ncbi:MAG TPA: hypothetical protein VKC54_03200 [Patescibacteria group bacterium]|nr:hypothetical protein [Patescibacteria group bacterium]